jgi:hypothetical protein
MRVREVIKFAVITIGPPVALCILGFLVAWIRKGFKESAEQRDEV